MRLISKVVEKDASGHVTLYPEELEDMWHVYNLIAKDDLIKATTIRRLQSESTTGSSTSQRVRMKLTITVEDVDFDPHAGLLRINGRVAEENPYVKMGSYHTIDLELDRNFTLFKPEWDTIALERVEDACDITKQADVAAIVCQEGLANVCFMTQHMTIVKQRIETPIPRKRRGSVANYEKGLQKFYDQIYQSILRLVDFGIIKAIIIASPGFVKDQVYQYIFDTAVKTDNKTVMENKNKFMTIHCSSGHKHALNEVMQNPAIQTKLANTKAASEVKALDDFYAMLNKDPDRAFYGYGHVAKAHERGAIGTLLVTDELFRSADVATRRKYVELVEQVRATGGVVRVFSSLHVSGEQLNQLTGVAAILNFPVPDIEDEDEEEEDTHDQNNIEA
ncbi:protein pelota [Radiomyces spectabilis]|uniref:protein pelota n=1 Tax=Radiomyces spectabilis TaxID=64574 RepID=UPI00221FB220|nr:protein pelota [Radiomyces spectabilis]KAI8377504.1 protein pelota [Radiomyces spectabilis]